MTIDAYLAALERSLPRISRRRVLAEAQEHLRDSAATHRAAGLSLPAAEAAAADDFGPVEIVARRLAAERAVRDTRISTLVALGAVAFFVFPLYVVPENSLPRLRGWRSRATSSCSSWSVSRSGSRRAHSQRRAPRSRGRVGHTWPLRFS